MGIESFIKDTNFASSIISTRSVEIDEQFDGSGHNWTLGGDFLIHRSEKSTVEITLKCVFYAISIFVALSGNLAVIIVVIRSKSLRTKFNIYIVNLAVADFFMPAISMWLHLGSNLNARWVFGQVMCRIHTFVQASFVCASVFTLSVLTADRYLSIIQSQYVWVTQTFQIVIIALIWIASIGIGSPWIVFTVFKDFNWLGGHEIICQADFPSILARKAYYVAFFVFCYMIPLVLMFVFVLSIIIKSNRRAVDTSNDGNTHHQVQRKAVYLLLTILVVFCVCWTPQQSLLLWDVFRDRNKKSRGIEDLQYTTLFMAYSSSGINPVVYFIFNKYFRHSLYHLCKTKCTGKDEHTTIAPDVERQEATENTDFQDATRSIPDTSDKGSSHGTTTRPVLRSLYEEDLTKISFSD